MATQTRIRFALHTCNAVPNSQPEKVLTAGEVTSILLAVGFKLGVSTATCPTCLTAQKVQASALEMT